MKKATKIFQDLFAEKTVLEIACGTGYLTERIAETDEYGNTFQTRKLENGTSHLILKNFPTEGFLSQKLSGVATDIKFINLEYYWIVSCKLAEKY